jgi:hypothetical protein
VVRDSNVSEGSEKIFNGVSEDRRVPEDKHWPIGDGASFNAPSQSLIRQTGTATRKGLKQK